MSASPRVLFVLVAVTILASTVCVPAAVRWEDWLRGNGKEMPSPTTVVPPPGEHPRALFTRADLPALRERPGSPLGSQFLQTVRWQIDYPGKDRLAKIEKGEKNEPDVLADFAFYAAATYLFTQEPAYLEKAGKFLDAWTVAVEPLPTQPLPGFSRSLHRLALTYDWLFADLPETRRDLLRRYMALRLDRDTNLDAWRRKAYAMGPSYSGRGCDWGAIQAGGVAMACLVLEGETPAASPEMLKEAVRLLKWIADYSLSPEGVTPNGNAYAGTDFVSYFNALWALQRRGINLIDHPHIREMPVWLAYEIVPGCYLYDSRNQSGGNMGASPTIIALAARFDGVAPWLQEQTLGPGRRIAGDPVGSVAALLYGRFPEQPPPLPSLPLYRYSSSMGTVYSRSGWNLGDSCFTITMEPPGQHHTHPDKGSFTFYSGGQIWAADSGTSAFGPEEHNSVLIDGKGQADGQGVSDAIVRTSLTSQLADLTWMDIKPAFDARLAYTETEGKAAWDELVPGRGLPLRWEPFAPVERNDRWAVYVRHPAGAYAVVVDAVRKDDRPHAYQWLLHTLPHGEVNEGTVQYRSAYQGSYYQAESGTKGLCLTATVPAAGDYRVWVLARPWPDLRSSHWFCTARVNGEWSTPFYLSHYCYDWQWVPVLHGKDKPGPTWNLSAGETKLEIGTKRGARIAQVVLSRDPEFKPTQGPVAATASTVVCQVDAQATGTHWLPAPQSEAQQRMDLIFLQPAAASLKLTLQDAKPIRYPPLQRLVAEQTAVTAGFAAVLLPWNSAGPEPQMVRAPTPGGGTTITRGGFTDHLFADPAESGAKGGPIVSDGKLAMVRTAEGGRVVGYLLAGGTRLDFAGQSLVMAERGPVCLVNDGATVQAGAPGGGSLKLLGLGAASARVNQQSLPLRGRSGQVSLRVPTLDKSWKIAFADDGREVTVTGDGPRPLKITAPDAIRCTVNGVSVWFSRAPGGCIYPKLDVTVPAHGEDPPPAVTK